MDKPMLSGLKLTFLAHAIVAFVLGIGLYVIPEMLATWVNWAPVDSTMTRFYGAAVLGLGVSSWLGYRAMRWDEVRILTEMEIAYTLLAIVAGLYAVLIAGAPVFTWVTILILVIFSGAFIYFYRADETMRTAPTTQRKSA